MVLKQEKAWLVVRRFAESVLHDISDLTVKGAVEKNTLSWELKLSAFITSNMSSSVQWCILC